MRRRGISKMLLVPLTAVGLLCGGVTADSAPAYVAPHGLELSGRWSVDTGLIGRQYWQFSAEPEAPVDTSSIGYGPEASLVTTVVGTSLTVVETYYTKAEYHGAIVGEHAGAVLTLHGTLSLNAQGEPEAKGTFTSSVKLATNAPPEEAWGGHDLFEPERGTTTSGAVIAAKCVVPRVKGKTLGQAEKAIVKAHCAVGTVKRTRSRHVKSGTVISQGQVAGKSLAHGSKVSLLVSKG
jgi:hypothetical protein